MDEWPWHEVLYALYGLLDVERVEGLARESEAVTHAYLTHHAMHAPKELQRDRDAVLRAWQQAPMTDAPGKDPIDAIHEFEAAMRQAPRRGPANRKVS